MKPTNYPPIPALVLPRTLFAADALLALPEELLGLGMRRPLLVTDQGVVAAGLAAKLVSALGHTVALTVFDAVTENPLFSDVDAGAAVYARAGCDGVLTYFAPRVAKLIRAGL